ncbi:MAG: molybdopterin cofactor-binding domain-containing protein [Candidatus Azotimanducaceae bacterium]
MKQVDISKRRFLITSSAGVAGLAISQFAVGKPVVNLLDPTSPLIIPENFEPCVWFTMQSSGKTNIHVFRQEIGQHIGTALAQIVAEELELDWSQVSIDYPEMDMVKFQKTGVQMTGGSQSVIQSFTPLSRSAAVAREFLVEAGADILG